MVLLLIFFSLIIFGYNYVTDANRVRDMAQDYLSQLIGGRVKVDAATLSIFEGLRLEGVKVYVDEGTEPDSLLFSAQSFTLKYDPAKIITGQIEAAEIIAQKPHVHLTEDARTHEWNFYRLSRSRERNAKPSPREPTGPPPVLPEVLLRNARVEISEIRDGKLRPIGYEAMDGHMSPSIEPGSFNFEIQTRGIEGVGPWATGTVLLGTSKVDLQLHDFDFSRDLVAMLPRNLRDFCERHEMSGRIPQLSVHYQPGKTPTSPTLALEMQLDKVNFSAQQEDYLSGDDVARRSLLRQTLGLMRPFYRMGGFGAGKSVIEATDVHSQARSTAGGRVGIVDDVAGGIATNVALPNILEVAELSSGNSLPATSPPRMPSSPADVIASLTETAPIKLHDGAGTFLFTESGLELKDVKGSVEGNWFLINGHMVGYSPDAPFDFQIRSLDGQALSIPETPRYFNSLPPLVRDIYTIIHPDGFCTMDTKISRPTPGSRLFINGHVDVVDGQFACLFFPYKLHEARGRVSFGYDEKASADFVYITGIRGRGMADGPNRDGYVEINGSVGPLGPQYPDPRILVKVTAKNVTSEPLLVHALPIEVREPLKIFDADKTGNFPTFHGDFSTTVLHENGWAWRWSFDTDLNLDDAAGKLVGFPYPVEHMAAEVHVRDGYVDIVNAHMVKGDASLRVDGRVSWGPMTPPDAPPTPPQVVTDLRVSVRNLQIDKDLLSALPPSEAVWLKRLGLGGKLNVVGRVFQGLPDPARPNAPLDFDNVNFDLAMRLHDGTLWPADGMFSLSDLSSQVHLTRDALEMKEIHAKRAGSDMTGEGALAWGDGPVQLAMHIKSKALPMDAPLYQLLPKSGRENWDQIQPHGTLEADINWRGSFDTDDSANSGKGDASTTQPATTRPATTTATQPNEITPSPLHPLTPSSPLPAIFSQIEPGLHAVLKPQGMTCTLKELAYRLDGITGTITITPEKITIADATAHHGNATLAVSGTGGTGDRSEWNLKISGKDVMVDDDFRHSMPTALLTMLDGVKFHGPVDFDLPKLAYHGEVVPGKLMATTKPAGVDADLEGTLSFNGSSMEAGAPMKDIFGRLTLANASVRNGKLAALQGNIVLPRVNIAGRDLSDVSFSLLRPADRQELDLQKIRGVLADGQIAGDVKLTYPDEGASRYLLTLVLRNADVEALVHDADKDLKGELTASLMLEGSWDDTGPRRGRGDVIVTGKELYHLPLMLGLFQVTNLALPIATPFKTGTARYSVEGPRVNFERVELKSDNMLMEGTGYLDFKTKQVRMTFTTDNPGGLKVPFLNDLIKNARGELLKITIKGTIKEPKVEANTFGTLTTTIDEVFKDDAKAK